MNTKILAFAGTKQSGKSTSCNFIHGYQMKCYGVVENFGITENGRLAVQTEILNEKGEEEVGNAILDVNRTDIEFAEWAIYSMWPYVKKYSFGTALKEICISLFGLKYEQVYGTEAHKNQILPHIRWENMPGTITDSNLWKDISRSKSRKSSKSLCFHEKGPMTVRDLLQYMGTDIMRRIYEPVWVNACLSDIKREEPLLAVIDDCRFLNEIEAIQAEGGKVIGLDRCPFNDSHKSEQDIKKNWGSLDAIIDNSNKTIAETNRSIIELLDSWGWLGPVLSREEMPFGKKDDKTLTGIHKIKKD